MNNKKEKTYINEKKAKFKNKQEIKQENKDLHKPNLQKSKHKYKHYHKQKILINNENDNGNNYEIEFHNVNDIDEKVGLGSSNNKFHKQNQCIHEYETHNKTHNKTHNILNNIFKNPFEYNPFVRQTNRLNIFIQLSNGYRIPRRLGIFQELSENEN